MERPQISSFVAVVAIAALALTACSGGARPRVESEPAGAATLPAGAAETEADTGSTASSTSTSTTSPSTTSTSTTVPLPPIVLHGTGDMNLDTGTIPNLAVNGFGWAFAGLEGQFLDDDLTLINLECTPSDQGTRQDRPFNFRCDPDRLPEIRAEGVDLVNLGNNHAMDYGADGLIDGLGRVRDAGLAVVGAGADRAEAFAPAVLDVAGWKVAVPGSAACTWPRTGWPRTIDPESATGWTSTQ